MKQQILNLFNDDTLERRKKISDYIKSDAPFEDRLEVWENTPEHLMTIKQWSIDLPEYEKKHGKIYWYEDFDIERREVVDLRTICYGDKFNEEQILDFITECMSLGIHGFVNDW